MSQRARATDILRLLILVAAVTMVGTGGLAGLAAAADTVKIGDLQPMTGPFEANGRAFAAGMQFAVDEQNAKGGLLGRKIEIIREDSELKPDVATRKAKKLILENKVNFFGNAMGSHVAIALTKVAANSKTLFINYGAMADEIMGKEFNPYVFRVTQNVYNMNTAIVAQLATTPYRRFYSIQGDYVAGYDNDKVIKELVKKHLPDAVFVGTDFHPLGTKDFAPYITKIIASKADAIVAGNFGPDFINLTRQARAMGLKAPFPIFAPLSNHPYILSELKGDATGVYFAHEYSLRVKTPENEDLIRRYHEMHKNDKDFVTWWPTSDVALAVLGWKMVFAAVERAGSLDTDKIIETLEVFEWKSPVGLWRMRKCDHQVILPMFSGVIDDTDNQFYDGRIRPEVKFPTEGPKLLSLPAERAMIPATPDYNPRCK
jgi:branched-chain amino acid transport system substrate-binding protein